MKNNVFGIRSADEVLRMAREQMRDRRARARDCICGPGDPCDYHAALGLGSIVDAPRVAAQEKSE